MTNPLKWLLSRLADLIPTERPWVWLPESWFDQTDGVVSDAQELSAEQLAKLTGGEL
jgi:hypothetical protein